VGSKAVREIVSRLQPAVGLHGHIHESAGKELLGRCWCLNPGSEYDAGILRGALLEFRGSELVDFAFTTDSVTN